MKGINFLKRFLSIFKKHNIEPTKPEKSFNDSLIEDWGDPDIYGPWTQFIENDRDDNKLFLYKEYYLVSYNDDVDIKKIHEKVMEDKRIKKLISLQSE